MTGPELDPVSDWISWKGMMQQADQVVEETGFEEEDVRLWNYISWKSETTV